jgi:hypothetical protein
MTTRPTPNAERPLSDWKAVCRCRDAEIEEKDFKVGSLPRNGTEGSRMADRPAVLALIMDGRAPRLWAQAFRGRNVLRLCAKWVSIGMLE